MMQMKTKTTGMPPMMNGSSDASEKEWELRPSGMLVQKRNPDCENRPPPPTIRVRVKYHSIYHEINISSQATFGELKKMLTGPTGLHHQDQKLLYKDKERDNKAFLDIAGVKDKSKIVLMEDPISQEKRYLEMRKNAKVEKAAKTISEITLEVDRLARQVSALESIISKGGRVVEKDLINLIELLMNQLVQLDGIIAEGDVKLQRKNQVRRVQKCVETLDVLKIKNSVTTSNGNHITKDQSSPAQQHQRYSNEQASSPVQQEKSVKTKQQQPSKHSSSGSVVITTQWETFDSTPAPLLDHFSSPTTTPSTHAAAVQPRLSWDLL
ncbi:BAG family molecular chaperone regulator 1-like [Nicotiana tabacum]|uniref:BAG family molecular chaperone regulator 1-like n=3 Tax=Nicotiana tabacum TaxID=4097 RepID=A0A1S4B8R6_TOBAC|nr:PREDICTED: BAG family molecular chaperone regulator 1-like [Nicotiana tabacum]XP_016485320.1 PREDICTED: BAG family molecular chaperone regulator 1-like [Nicotiana tabacum]